MHSSLPSTSPMALEYFNVRWPLMYEGKWDQWMERGAGTALQFVYTGQALRTAELTQRHSPSVLFHPFRNGRKAEGPHICFSWIMYLPCMAQYKHHLTCSPPPHLPQLAGNSHYKFLSKSGILTAAVQDTAQENGPSMLTAGPGCSDSTVRLLI